jgi:hypothetical protein
LLESLASDIREMEILRKEVSASVMMYAIFIFLAATFAAPLLYAIAGYLVETMGRLGLVAGPTPVAVRLPIVLRVVTISPQFLGLYSLSAILITCLFGGLIIGVVREGSEKGGLKIIPLMLIIALLLYFGTKSLVVRIFGISF